MTKETILIIEKNDEAFKKALTLMEPEKFNVERSLHYGDAWEKIQNGQYKHIICEINLTDPECFQFIGKVKELPFNHANFLIPLSSFLKEQNKLADFAKLLNSSEQQKRIESILEADFSTAAKKTPSESWLKISTHSFLPHDKAYLFDYTPDEILIGLIEENTPSLEETTLHLDIKVQDNQEELVFKGKFEKIESFDCNDENTIYLSFKLDEESQNSWKKYFDLFEAESQEMLDMLEDIRGW